MDEAGAAVAVVSAGGLVRRERDGVTQVALVRRERYEPDEWTLPKGKVADQDESLAATAVREVREETGATVLLDEVADVIDYPLDHQKKVVVFWLMTYVGEAPGERDAGEVKEVRWLPPHEAVRLLKYPKEQALLTTAASHENFNLLPPPRRRWFFLQWFTRAGRFFRHWSQRPQMNRLLEEINDLTAELAEPRTQELPPWRVMAVRHVAKAREAAAAGDLDTGWSQTYRARECQIAGFDDDEVLREASVVRDELLISDKFGKWRRTAAKNLLAPVLAKKAKNKTQSASDRVERLQAAVRVRNESFANEYRKLTLLRRHQLALLGFGIVSMLAIIGVLLPHATTLDSDSVDEWWVMLAAVLLGVVGAVTSAAQRSTRLNHGRIPQLLGSTVASMSRVPVGAVAGLLAWLAGNTGLAPASGTAATILVGAFAAGFTERLVAASGDAKT